MSTENKIIKLNSISRHTIDDQQCIVLDNQQDSLDHVHSLVLIPAIEQINVDGSKDISFPDGESQLLIRLTVGLFPICFNMQTQYGYLVLGIVPQGVIPDFTHGSHFPVSDAAVVNRSVEDIQHDLQMTHQWIASRRDWVKTNGIVIYA